MTRTRPRPRTRALISIATTALLAVGVTACSAPSHATHATATASSHATTSTNSTPDAYSAPSASAVALLPEDRYDAVIGGLLPYYGSTIPKTADDSYTITSDAPLYGDDRDEPVARLAAKNFLGDASVVVPVAFSGPWAMILTPARQALPSATHDGAAAQSAAWIRRDLLVKKSVLADHVVVSVGHQTLSIVAADGHLVHTFPAGVGTAGTPTPEGVIGYIQARYLDPAQDQTVHPIQLTSLHSAAADEPYGGHDGGLIGVHYESVSRGAVSHGCVRLAGDAVDAVNALPLGTLVEIVA